ncbi:MAG: haloalkane dehalogenase [Leptospiraceae bacterium]|nr:haloalkane dehalogenase [Leptospiraceae bacterium]
MDVQEVLKKYEESGNFFKVNGVQSFALDQGKGDPVLCIHGVPASAYLYRKVVPALARHNLRGLAFDLPGLGLADRPEDFDYSWSGLSHFCEEATEALGLRRFHLVVHDIGGPIGLMLAARKPERIQSLTILNTLIDADSFHRPWMMAPFAWPVIDRLWLGSMNRWLLYLLFRYTGVSDFSHIPRQEIYAYVDLLKRDDGGRAFLKIMRGFELTSSVREQCHAAVASKMYPRQIIWGMQDRALKLKKQGKRIMDVTQLGEVTRVKGKHFLQEDNAEIIAQRISRLTQNKK